MCSSDLQEYRAARQVDAMRPKTPEEKVAAMNKIRAEIALVVIPDGRTDDEIIGYNEFGHFD